MRKIKFRALELETGNTVYGSYVFIIGECSTKEKIDTIKRHYIIDSFGVKHEISKNTLCQLFSYQDKNKKEVYELDVFSNNQIIVFDNDKKGFYIINPFEPEDDWFYPAAIYCLQADEYKVTGTIFDAKYKDIYNKVKKPLGLK